MKKLFIEILNPKRRHLLSLFALVLMMFSLIWSRWLISFGMAILIGNAVLHKDALKHLKYFLQSKWLLSITLIFFIYFLSGLYSEGHQEWLKHIRLKLPFLLLPFSWVAMKRFTKEEFNFLLSAFISICLISTIPVIWAYFQSASEINDSYLRAQVLPTPISHIRYSILLTLAIVCSIWLSLRTYSNRAFNIISILAGLWLFAFLHLLAVRSGLLALYLSLGFVFMFFSIQKKKWWILALGLTGMLLMPVISWYTVPTFQNKVKYAQWDLGIFTSKKDRAQYSDSRRLFSWTIGLEVFKDAPLLGSGIGDLKREMDLKYLDSNPAIDEADRIMPHNQWLYILSGCGIIGLLLFLLSQFYLIFSFSLAKSWLYISFHIIMMASFIPEATLEAQLGVSIYVLFILIIAHQRHPERLALNPELDN